MEQGPQTFDEYLRSLSTKSLRLHTLEDTVQELQTRLHAVEGAAALGRSDSPSRSDPRLLTILEESLAQSRNSSTGRLAAVIALLQKNPFKDHRKQKLELWLQHATRLLESSGCDRESWGTALLSALDTAPQQAVYQQLNDAGDAAAAGDDTFCSYEQVTDVLKALYTSKETSGEFLEQLIELSLTAATPDAIGIYRDSDQRMAAIISQRLYSEKARCLLITSKMPDPVQVGLAILEPIKVPSDYLGRKEWLHLQAGWQGAGKGQNGPAWVCSSKPGACAAPESWCAGRCCNYLGRKEWLHLQAGWQGAGKGQKGPAWVCSSKRQPGACAAPESWCAGRCCTAGSAQRGGLEAVAMLRC